MLAILTRGILPGGGRHNIKRVATRGNLVTSRYREALASITGERRRA